MINTVEDLLCCGPVSLPLEPCCKICLKLPECACSFIFLSDYVTSCINYYCSKLSNYIVLLPDKNKLK